MTAPSTLIAFADLISKKFLSDWKTTIINISTLVGFKVTNWAEGGFTRTLMALFATMYTTGSDIVRQLAASAFLDTAEGDWLKFLAKEVFGVDAIEATFAAADKALTLTNTGGGLFTFAPGDIIAKNGANKTYRNTSGGTLPPGPGTTLTVDLIAEEAGSGSSAAVGTITELVTAFLGVTCTNTIALVGLDEEEPEDLRRRCRDSVAAGSVGGPEKAYEYWARSATRPDGSPIGVTRVSPQPPTGSGSITIYIAGASGAISPTDVAYVQQTFDEKVTPYGLNAIAVSATNRSVTVPCTIWIPAVLGLSTADAQQAVFDALQAYVQRLPIGGVVIPPAAGTIYWRALLGIVEGSIPGMLKAQLSSEVDVVLAVNEVPVWAGLLSQTTVMQVA